MQNQPDPFPPGFYDFHSVQNLESLLNTAEYYRQNPRAHRDLGRDKTLGLLFFNPSTRTRMSTEVAARNLGMDVITLTDAWAMEFGPADTVMNGTSVEHVREAAPVLGQYCDILGVRSFPALKNRAEDEEDRVYRQFATLSGVPVVSLESALFHPLQSLADLLTIRQLFPGGRRPKVILTWAPHVKALPHCVANSFAQWITGWGGADFVVTHPEGYELDPRYTAGATITHDQQAALQDADIVYVKNWSATAPYGAVTCHDTSWMLTPDKLRHTNNARVMHCLPVRRNMELSSDVLDSAHSAVIQQAGNRVWAAQAVLSTLIQQI